MKDIEILEEFAKEYKDTGYFGIIKAEQIQILDNILKERQADKEKIKEYAELLIKVNVQNLNNSIEQRKESNEQLEALHEGWKIELEKKDNRIKELYEIIINNKPHIAQQKLKLYIEELLKDGGE